MIVLLDMDEVIVDFVGGALAAFARKTGMMVPRVEVRDVMKIGELCTDKFGSSPDPWLHTVMSMVSFWEELEPVDGAIDGIRKLQKSHDVLIVTAVNPMCPETYVGKLRGIQRNLPSFPIENYFPVRRKELVRGDVLVDDHPDFLLRFPGPTIVVDRPWNRDLITSWTRVSDWAGIVSAIDDLDHELI